MLYFDWILNTDKDERIYTAPRVICNDGVSLSVQVGEGLYCTPRDNYAPWSKVEVGFPSATPPNTWAEYFDGEWHSTIFSRFFGSGYNYLDRTKAAFRVFGQFGKRKYYNGWIEITKAIIRDLKRVWHMGVIAPVGCDSVYGYIPVDLVREYIELHGGEDTEACLAQFDEIPAELLECECGREIDERAGGTLCVRCR
jgi:hypothetical protein